jgi:hypothetical protein
MLFMIGMEHRNLSMEYYFVTNYSQRNTHAIQKCNALHIELISIFLMRKKRNVLNLRSIKSLFIKRGIKGNEVGHECRVLWANRETCTGRNLSQL